MKKILYILFFALFSGGFALAQDDTEEGGGKLRDKMIEYIQDKLSLSKAEAEKFQPIFLDYLKQLRATKNEFKGDKLVLNQKIAEIRLRTREQLKPIIGEQRSNKVFEEEGTFIKKVKEERDLRLQNRKDGPANKRMRALLQ